MDANLDPRYLNHEEETSNGHYARFSFSVHHFPTIPPTWQFSQVYYTHCKTFPTFWEILIKTKNGPRNSCFVTLSRKDYINRPVDAYIWVSCFDINNRRLCYPKVFSKKRILPYENVEGCIQEMIPLEEMGILPQQELVIEVSVSISGCHKKIVPSAVGLDSDFNKMQFSKL